MRNADLRPPICPSCAKVTWIRWMGGLMAKCKSCGHKANMAEFYGHNKSYAVLGGAAAAGEETE